MAQRTAEEIQQEIEQARTSLAVAVDEIAERTNPKRLTREVKQNLRDRAQSPAGRAVLGAAGALVVVLVIRRIRRRSRG